MRRIALMVLSTALSIAVGALLFEGIARIAFDDGMDFDLEMWKYARDLKRVSANPAIAHEHRPNTGGVYMGVPVQINSIGLRDRELAAGGKPVGRVRTVMLGDSLTFGWGVRAEDTPSRQLEALLNGTSAPDPRYEVINTGVGNYNTPMEVAYFVTEGYKFDPDVVVLNYFINDAEPTPYRKQSWLGEHSAAYVVFASAIDKVSRILLGRADWKTYYRDLYEPEEPGWQQAKASIHRLASFCRERGYKLILVSYPELHDLKDYPFPEVTGAVERIAFSEHIPFLDLRPSVMDLAPDTLWVSPSDAHPNRIANERFSKAMADVLTETYPELFGMSASVATENSQ
ncbi:SGNH/GDSL hydrolase family protein [Sinorhizobium mexicanum]|nr:SGNH/GDSL hydrolase family protein [Sinorhizobium mexicanum]MBP1883761.1 lysophospholipase L1-like esterase [Sinorhizobium mexicanum]